MDVTPCQTYHAVMENCETVTMPDGLSVFKVYFASIVGRATPERFEWGSSPLSKDGFIKAFKDMPFTGVGFVTAFPHIAKLFRFAPKNEVLLHVTAFKPATGEPVALDRGEGFTEFACLAEALIAAQEYDAWAKADDVRDYLEFTAPLTDAPVRAHDKLHAYAAAKHTDD